MRISLDTRGLSYPQLVLMILDKIRVGGVDEMAVMLDNATMLSSISHTVMSNGWQIVGISIIDNTYNMTIKKGSNRRNPAGIKTMLKHGPAPRTGA